MIPPIIIQIHPTIVRIMSVRIIALLGAEMVFLILQMANSVISEPKTDNPDLRVVQPVLLLLFQSLVSQVQLLDHNLIL